MIEPYEELANAIVLQAVEDYRAIPVERNRLERKLHVAEQRLQTFVLPQDNARIEREQERYDDIQSQLHAIDIDRRRLERFFRSEWFRILTDVNGELVLQRLRQEAQEVQVAT